MFIEEPSMVCLTAKGDDVVPGEWQHVGVTVGWDSMSSTSTVTFIRNGVAFSTFPHAKLLVTDNESYSHYIGGIRHNWRLFEPYRGFIYSFFVSNYIKTNFADTVKRQPDCAGSCEICTKDMLCLPNCEYNEWLNGANMCTTCSHHFYCNICSDKCTSCHYRGGDPCS
jgi:hypothetical protein